jgi:hypothetical protein
LKAGEDAHHAHTWHCFRDAHWGVIGGGDAHHAHTWHRFKVDGNVEGTSDGEFLYAAPYERRVCD